MNNFKLNTKLFILLTLFLVFNQQVYAYIDPGTGSMIIQMLIAGSVALIYAVKLQWKNLKGFAKKLFAKKGENE